MYDFFKCISNDNMQEIINKENNTIDILLIMNKIILVQTDEYLIFILRL